MASFSTTPRIYFHPLAICTIVGRRAEATGVRQRTVGGLVGSTEHVDNLTHPSPPSLTSRYVTAMRAAPVHTQS